MVFVGFNLTFFPQFLLGYLGMPRRYHAYPDEFQVLNVMSTAGASILAVGYVIPLVYLIWSLRYGKVAGPNPWKIVIDPERHRGDGMQQTAECAPQHADEETRPTAPIRGRPTHRTRCRGSSCPRDRCSRRRPSRRTIRPGRRAGWGCSSATSRPRPAPTIASAPTIQFDRTLQSGIDTRGPKVIGLHRKRFLAKFANDAQQPLGYHPYQGGLNKEQRHPEIQQTGDAARCIIGMQCR